VEPHPIRLVVTDDLRRNRLIVLFRLLLAIPHFIWLVVWGIGNLVVLILSWFAAVFTGRVPTGFHDFMARYLTYQTHVLAYLQLAADPYPSFDGGTGYPVDLEVAPPVVQSRLTVFFRVLLAIPALVISYVMNYLVNILVLFGWFASLFLGRMPEGMRNLILFTLRYHIQTAAYYSLLTPRYPSLNVGLDAT
jgi:Domain of unknown function (DUF4389)